MKHNIYYLENSHHGRVYFTIRDGLVQCDGTPTKVPEDKLIDFLAIAKELGMKGASYERLKQKGGVSCEHLPESQRHNVYAITKKWKSLPFFG